jgi:transcriptional regulator with XRE-family HTH domain
VTPFGARLRQLRESRDVTLTELAAALHVSAAYLSALEHGRRGRPSAGLIHQVNEFFGLIWDEAEEMVRLARLSHPRVMLDTAGLAPEATELANLLATRIRSLSPQALERMRAVLEDEERRRAGE